MTEATPPQGTRLIVASENLLDFFGTRSEDGRRLTFGWGEPDANGWYTPTITTHQDDDWLPQNAAADRLVTIEKAARAVERAWSVAQPNESSAPLRALRAALEGASE